MGTMAEAQGGVRNPAEARAEIGAFALAAETVSEAEFIASIGRSFAELADDAWPERGFACTAVDAETGGFQFWTKTSGVGVTRAVASSCSVPGVYPPVTLKGRRYIDGGMRSSTNADMAGGYDLVVVVAVRLGAAGGAAAERIAARFDEEIESLKEGGSTVVTIVPDAASIEAFGPNLMDFRRRADAAQAGLAQGQSHAADLKELWG
jgi:NTE family protein